ncbi:NADH-cytochrome b5 reductase [Scheffersomyces spartinae]|uniref:NADH-cytochrome b5 reductase n=1 Tax=Scheffersomyces spartinae TaxID=45513 RepID=A0A9P7VCB1_9ASCO|nr:NADH-cytochrome b5 reductase [Scheffersomyces spartinae]KAG7195183.1 NADH-cytochrome b5 reductase [Scheffersomyces spartinae]
MAFITEDANPLAVFGTIALIIGTFVVIYLVKSQQKAKPILIPDEFQKFPLIKKTRVSHNSAVYRFGLPNSSDRLGLPIGQHISLGAVIEGKEVVRSYTPISTDDELGYFDLLIKTYESGNISRVVDKLEIGDTMDVRGPKGFFTYTPNMVESFGMIAGGTGIAPMYQVLTAIMRNPADKTKVTLLYANVSESDILLKDELDQMAKDHADQFKVHYVLNQAPENWSGSVGFVTPELIDEYLPKAKEDCNILLCGPPPMISAMKKSCVGLGFPKCKPVSKLGDKVFVF